MKKHLVVLSVALLVGCIETNVDDVALVEEDMVTRSVLVDEYDLDALSELFAEDVRLLDEQEQTESYSVEMLSTAPFTHSKVLSLEWNIPALSDIDKLLVLANSDIYDQIADKIERYAYDIATAYDCDVIVEKIGGGTHVDIKNLILSYQTNLNGVVFIGDIPYASFELANDHNKYGYRKWPCDLYYMDLDGTWEDADGNSIYDTHTGNRLPEIFVGRISTINMGRSASEIELLNSYFDKNHEFWNGPTTVNGQSGLSYVDKDWADLSSHKSDIQYLYGSANYESKIYGDANFGKADYLSRLNNYDYEFIHVSCHTSPTYMAMSGGSISANEIYANGTDAIGYNLFCCSACNWTATSSSSTSGFLAGSYIYNPHKKSLVAVGSTKTGSMLYFSDFFIPLGQGKPIGIAFKEWWSVVNRYAEQSRISWFYGMTIIGDPMINFFHVSNAEEITLNSFDTYDPSPYRNIVAWYAITANDYMIPAGKHVTFNAPVVTINDGFSCDANGSFIINN